MPESKPISTSPVPVGYPSTRFRWVITSMVLLLSGAFLVVGAIGFLYLQTLNDKITALSLSGTGDPRMIELPETVARLEQRLGEAVIQNNEQEEKISRLEQQVGGMGQSQAAVAPAPAQPATGTEGIAAGVAPAPAAPVLTPEQLAVLEQRIATLEMKVTQHQENLYARQFTVLNALWMLQFKLDHALPFEHELRAMEAYAQNFPSFTRYLEPLQPFADEGIKTLDDLRGSFRRVGADILEKARSGAEDLPWYQKTINNIKGVVVVRHVHRQVESTRPEDIVANIQELLTSGDLNLAVLEVERLPDSYREITAPWLVQAKARLSAETSVNSLYEQLLLLTEAEQIGKSAP